MSRLASKNLTLKKRKFDPVGQFEEDNMPVYEFECSDGHVTEELVRMGTKSTQCSKCDKKARKIMSQCSFELKGGGWYADGYSSKGAPKESKSSKKSKKSD
jgi:putative FmdB family regulatory protein